jgi:hypothetical protein
LSSTHIRPAAVRKSLAFGSTQICRLGLPIYRVGSGPIDPDPSEDPELFDVLLPGLNYHIIHGDISKKLGCEYLSRVPKHVEFLKPSAEISGILPLITTLKDRSHYLHFLFDYGSPYMYLSYEVSRNHNKNSTFNDSLPFLGLHCFLAEPTVLGCHVGKDDGVRLRRTCFVDLVTTPG